MIIVNSSPEVLNKLNPTRRIHSLIQTTSETPIENKRGKTINGVSGALIPQDPESEDELIARKYKK